MTSRTTTDTYPILRTTIDQHRGTHDGTGLPIFVLTDVVTDLSSHGERRWDALTAEDRAWWEATTEDVHHATVALESLDDAARVRARRIIEEDDATGQGCDLEYAATVIRQAIEAAKAEE